jgi:hypothetical protein
MFKEKRSEKHPMLLQYGVHWSNKLSYLHQTGETAISYSQPFDNNQGQHRLCKTSHCQNPQPPSLNSHGSIRNNQWLQLWWWLQVKQSVTPIVSPKPPTKHDKTKLSFLSMSENFLITTSPSHVAAEVFSISSSLFTCPKKFLSSPHLLMHGPQKGHSPALLTMCT